MLQYMQKHKYVWCMINQVLRITYNYSENYVIDVCASDDKSVRKNSVPHGMYQNISTAFFPFKYLQLSPKIQFEHYPNRYVFLCLCLSVS